MHLSSSESLAQKATESLKKPSSLRRKLTGVKPAKLLSVVCLCQGRRGGPSGSPLLYLHHILRNSTIFARKERKLELQLLTAL